MSGGHDGGLHINHSQGLLTSTACCNALHEYQQALETPFSSTPRLYILGLKCRDVRTLTMFRSFAARACESTSWGSSEMRIAKIILLSAPAVHLGLDIFKDDTRLAQECAAESCSSQNSEAVVYAGDCSRQVRLVMREYYTLKAETEDISSWTHGQCKHATWI